MGLARRRDTRERPRIADTPAATVYDAYLCIKGWQRPQGASSGLLALHARVASVVGCSKDRASGMAGAGAGTYYPATYTATLQSARGTWAGPGRRMCIFAGEEDTQLTSSTTLLAASRRRQPTTLQAAAASAAASAASGHLRRALAGPGEGASGRCWHGSTLGAQRTRLLLGSSQLLGPTQRPTAERFFFFDIQQWQAAC